MPAEGQPDLWLIQIIGHEDLDDEDLPESRVKQLQATYGLVADGIVGVNTRNTVRVSREFHWPIGGWLGVGEKREDSYTDEPAWTGFERIHHAKVFETEASAQQWISNKLVVGIRFQPVRFMAL